MRCGCGAVAIIFSIYLKPVLYKPKNKNAHIGFWTGGCFMQHVNISKNF